jgi:hypothetical protein
MGASWLDNIDQWFNVAKPDASNLGDDSLDFMPCQLTIYRLKHCRSTRCSTAGCRPNENARFIAPL